MKWILESPTTAERNLVGGKAAGLAHLQAAGFAVPDWFVLTPAACLASLKPALSARLAQVEDTQEAVALLAGAQLSAEVLAELRECLQRLAPAGTTLAVRSSALDEDNRDHSFAGQLETYLNVPPSEVSAKIVAVWQSAFAARVWTYRQQQGLSARPSLPAVIVQRMIQADAAGVAFSSDPVRGRRGVSIVTAVHGSGDALVSGQATGDTYHVTRTGTILFRDITSEACPLSDDQVREIARLAREVAAHAGLPQDIEWAMEHGRLHLLQARPITTLRDLADPEGEGRLWDNSNIVESYGGMTTPLTYSFARHAYEGVYRQFCRLMQVPESAIANHADTFGSMIGYIRGRVYYNLTNWYRVLALLPGYKFNRSFMEQMMGVEGRGQKTEDRGQRSGVRGQESGISEAIGNHRSAIENRKSKIGNFLDLLRLVRTVTGLIWNHLTLERQIRAFRQRLDQALLPLSIPLEQMRSDELIQYYRTLERQLLTRWDAPLVNDFFAMIFHGVLRRLCEKWCGNANGALANDLIRQQGGLISAEPAQWLNRLAEEARAYSGLVTALQSGTLNQIERHLKAAPEVATGVRAYVEKFGERCAEELKLESQTLRDDPLPLYRSIGALAAASQQERAQSTPAPPKPDDLMAQTELGDRPNRALIFRWVLRNARDRVRDRENLRFERTRLFGRIRRLFTELGRRFYADGNLNDPGEIFFLEIDEALGACEGTATCVDLQALATLRRQQFERWKTEPPPANRFESRGAVHQGVVGATTMSAAPTSQSTRVGQGCCTGIVRGKARCVTDPRQAGLRAGEILVAERTDPGWVLLFPSAAGLLVERGSLLSHSAIVARELGLPAVIGVPGLMTWLQTGDEVELNGSTGEVRRLAN
jgi:pyruvate,water dikinase